jgi:hypothetical protein
MKHVMTLDERILAIDQHGYLVELSPGITVSVQGDTIDGLCRVRLGETELKVFGADLAVRAHAA